MSFKQNIKKTLSFFEIKEVYVNAILVYTFFYALAWIFFFFNNIVFNFDYSYHNFLYLTIILIITQLGFILSSKDDENILKRIIASACLSFVLLSSSYVPDIIKLKLNHADLKTQTTFAKITNLPLTRGKSGYIVSYESEKFSSNTIIKGYLLSEIEKAGMDKYYIEIFYVERNELIYITQMNFKKIHTIIIYCQNK